MIKTLQHIVPALFDKPVVSLILTWGAFEIGRWAQRMLWDSPLVNPVLIAILLIIPILELSGISYDTYLRGAGFIHFLLGPAAVALAIPIYDNRGQILKTAGSLLAGIIAGASIASASAVTLALWLGSSMDVVRSIAPKSVTTPIAIGISREIGGTPSLTVVFVILTGIIAAMLCGRFFDWIGVHDWKARGVATGVAGHGIGTAQMLTIDKSAGAFAGLSIGLTGLFTALLLPAAFGILRLMFNS